MINDDNDEQPAGFVDAGALHAFVAVVPPLERADLLDSTLFAQLAANKAAERMSDFAGWYEKYFDVLSQVGWRINNFSFEPFKPGALTFTVKDVIRSVLMKWLSESELVLLDETLSALQCLPPEDPPRVVFDTYGRSPHAINLQVGVRAASRAWSTAVVLETKEVILDTLGQRLKVASLIGDIRTTVQDSILNEEIYATVRESVIEKLGERRGTLILDLDRK